VDVRPDPLVRDAGPGLRGPDPVVLVAGAAWVAFGAGAGRDAVVVVRRRVGAGARAGVVVSCAPGT
jgi:hypothetical protein